MGSPGNSVRLSRVHYHGADVHLDDTWNLTQNGNGEAGIKKSASPFIWGG
jgi:hypothetical protein